MSNHIFLTDSFLHAKIPSREIEKQYKVTGRLIPRQFTPDDIPSSFRNWTSDDNVTGFLRWKTHESIEVTRKVISSCIDSCAYPDFHQWAIEESKSQEVIGAISSVDMDDETEMIHIGYALGSRYWSKGYMTEALGKVIEIFFT